MSIGPSSDMVCKNVALPVNSTRVPDLARGSSTLVKAGSDVLRYASVQLHLLQLFSHFIREKARPVLSKRIGTSWQGARTDLVSSSICSLSYRRAIYFL